MSDFLIQKLEAIKNRYSHIQDNRSDQAVDDCIAIVGHEALSFKPTPDNPCGHSLCIHDVCKRCGTLGALEYMAKHQKRFVDDFDAKVATDANNAEHAKDLLSHTDSKITQRVYIRKATKVTPLNSKRTDE